MATAEDDTYVLEFTQVAWDKVKDRLFKMQISLDWFTLLNYLKRQWI